MSKKANAKAIKDARRRMAEIDKLIPECAKYLERVSEDLRVNHTRFSMKPLTDVQRKGMERGIGRNEDAQQELPAEREDLQRYMGRLLDPEAAWPDEDDQMRRFLCAEERDKIARYCDPVLRREAMPN